MWFGSCWPPYVVWACYPSTFIPRYYEGDNTVIALRGVP